jgi:alkylation response protein AidB-like acyl-CoA dehydrogenase
MPVYTAPTRDAAFIINEVLGIEQYSDLPGFESASADIVTAVLDEAGKFAAEVLAPLNASGDQEGCSRNQDGSVTTPTGFREAHGQFREAGWGTLSAPEQFGGQGMPEVLGFAVEEFMSSANMAFSMYPGLTNGAVSALLATGSSELQEKYVPKMVANEWLGTMNLTEPHCGTDLGLIRTKAEPQADGSYAVTGTKIFISAGEHDLTENIIHLVLARTPDAPEGTKGISLFVVPKVLVVDDGSLGERNAVSCGALEHKMGIHGNATCVMNYDGATGWLVGEENKGLAAMFIMMNAARLGVGIQGLSQADVAYQNGVAYALERRQGRALSGPAEPDEKADLLVVHPDVRRMLMVATAMQQIWGGHGYIVENGMEQFVRDARIAMIYEGANGVQAMDLVGRKLARNGGRAVQAFFAMVDEECESAKGNERLSDLAQRVAKANGELKAATMWFMQNAMAKPDNAGAGAHHYMHIMGIVALGLMWLRMAKVAAERLDCGEGDSGFYEAKLATARYFGERYTPDAGALRRRIETGAEAMMALAPEAFQR